MMIRNTLAVAITAFLAANTVNAAEIYNKDANKLDLYGKVSALHYFSGDNNEGGDHSYVRLGFKGETQINDQLAGYGQWEYHVKASKSEADGTAGDKTRLGFAGLKFAEWGSLDYGRNYGVVYDVESWTDMLPEFGGDTYSYTDNFMNGRTNNIVTYRNNNFFDLVDGLNFALQYQGKNEGSRNVTKQNGEGYGLSATYDLGYGISVGGAYSASNRTEQQKSGVAGAKGDKAEVWTVGAKYDDNGIYLATMYADTRNMTPFGDYDVNGGQIADKTQNFEVTAQYQFVSGTLSGLRPEVSYLQSKGKSLVENNQSVGNKDLVKYVSVGTTYYFNKNMSTYVDYRINLLNGHDNFYKDNGIATDNIVATGLVYQF